MRRRCLLVAILAYVTLDLSLASMPGAFVFDAASSVDSAHRGRGRAAAEIVVTAAVIGTACVPVSPRGEVTEPAQAMRPAVPRPPSTPRCRARAALEPAAPSEDPH
ncbi:MAG: hypothetical protein WED01_10825 [Candidatus Rokuibacteriota bacterium]